MLIAQRRRIKNSALKSSIENIIKAADRERERKKMKIWKIQVNKLGNHSFDGLVGRSGAFCMVLHY